MAQVRQDKVQVEVEINGKKVTDTLADIGKAYRTAQKEVRQLTRGTEEFAEKQRDIAALKNELNAARNEVRDYQEVLDGLQPRSLRALQRQAQALEGELRKLDPASDEAREKMEQLGAVESELEEVKNETERLRRELANLPDDSIEALTQKAKELEQQLAKLPAKSKAFAATAAELKKVNAQLEETKERAGDAGEGVTGFAGLAKKAFGSLDAFMRTTIIGALAGIVLGIVNMGREAIRVTKEFQSLRQELNLLTGETGDELNALAADVTATVRTFGAEQRQLIKATLSASTSFNQSYSESLALVQKGLLVTGKQGDEFLDQIKEYSPQLKLAGLTAEQSFAVVAASIKNGSFSDTLIDSVKEFNIRIKDLSAEQQRVLEQNLGTEFTRRITTGIETGTLSSIEAMQQVSAELGELGADSAATQRVISNIFGGPGENVGADFIISLQDVGGSMDDLIDTSNIYTQRLLEQLDIETELATAQAELSFQTDGVGATFKNTGLTIKAFFYDQLAELAQFINYFPENFRIFRVRILEEINELTRDANESFNNFINTLSGVAEIITGVDFGEANLSLPEINIPTGSVELQKQLQEQIAKDRDDFAEKQEVETLVRNRGQVAADRLAQSRASSSRLQELQKSQQDYSRKVREASDRLQQLRTSLNENETEQRIAAIRIATEREIRAFEGSETQKVEFMRLRREQARREIAEIEEASFRERIVRAQIQAEEEARVRESSNSQIISERITQERSIELLEAYEARRIAQISASAQAEIEAITETGELATAERVRIERERVERIAAVREESTRTITQARSSTELAADLATRIEDEEALRDELLRIQEETEIQRIERVRSFAEQEIEETLAANLLSNEERVRIEQELNDRISAIRQEGAAQRAEEEARVRESSNSQIISERITQERSIELLEAYEARRIAQISASAQAEIEAITETGELATAERVRIERERVERIAAVREESTRTITQARSSTELAADLATRIEDEEALRDELLRIQEETEIQRIERVRSLAEQEIEETLAANLLSNEERVRIEQELNDRISAIRQEGAAQRVAIESENLSRILTEEQASEIEQAESATYDERMRQLQRHHERRQLEIQRQVLDEAQAGTLQGDLEAELQDRLLSQLHSYLVERATLEEAAGMDAFATHKQLEEMKLQATRDRLQEETRAQEESQAAWERQLEEQLSSSEGRREFLKGSVLQLADELQEINTNILERQTAELEQSQTTQLSILRSRQERELQQFEGTTEQRDELVQQHAEQRERVEVDFDAKRQMVEQRALRRRRAIAIAQKGIAISETGISTARSIMKVSEVIPFPASIPFQVALGLLGAAQIAAIATKKFQTGGKLPGEGGRPLAELSEGLPFLLPLPGQPRYNRGGYAAVRAGHGGMTIGPGHDRGGIALVDRRSGREVGEVEGGEPILSRATYENNRPVIDRLLYSSMFQGGAPIYRDGGILEAPSTTPSTAGVARAGEVAAGYFDDARILDELREVKAAVRGIKLRIGELEAVDIVTLSNEYDERTKITTS